MEKLFIPVIVGTARPGNISSAVAAYVESIAQEFGFETQLILTEEYATTMTANDGPEVDAWKEIAGRADGFIIVTPEYNHSYPGELKLLMDKAYDEYNHKPVGMVAVAAGGLGGTRVLESLLPVFNTYKLISLRDGVYFTQVHQKFEDGKATAETREGYDERVAGLCKELSIYAEGMKSIREQLTK